MSPNKEHVGSDVHHFDVTGHILKTKSFKLLQGVTWRSALDTVIHCFLIVIHPIASQPLATQPDIFWKNVISRICL